MMQELLPWKRYWCHLDGQIAFGSDGYPYDPEDENLGWFHKDVYSFPQLSKFPCLILLSEAGLGKTTAIKSEIRSRNKEKSQPNNDIIFWKDINEYGDENRLIHEVFGSYEFTSWMSGEYTLELFLDSFDECQIQIPTISKIIYNKLQIYQEHLHRLKFRIICRVANWPVFLENYLKEFWSEKDIGVFKLLPLLKKDIIKATQKFNLDNESFFEAIEKKDAQAFAIHPFTLKMLLNEFSIDKEIQVSKFELFKRGCELLCTEFNPERRAAKAIGYLSSGKRLILASRIAAIMSFCNKSTIYLGVDTKPLLDSDIALSMIQEGEETLGSCSYYFDEKDLREVISETGLFVGNGSNRFGFANHAYEEFLAAYYITTHDLEIQQIKSLIQLSNDPEQRTIPQLKGIASWLNIMNLKLIEETIKTDPQILLSSDIDNLEVKYRKSLLESLLKLFEQQKLIDSDWGLHFKYYKLSHTEIAEQLRPYIEDEGKHWLVRRVAIDIAEACKVIELQELLADISLNKNEDLHIREQAAYAVAQIADATTRERMKPLIFNKNEEDVDDGLKGSALRALWPNQLSAKELFNSLSKPKRDSLFGSYWSFLTNDILPHIKVDDLPIALEWAKNHQGNGYDFSHTSTLAESILIFAWKNLERSDVLDTFVDAIIPRLKNHINLCPIPKEGINEENLPTLRDDIRKSLIAKLISKIEDFDTLAYNLIQSEPILIFEKDMEWLIQQLEDEKDEIKQKAWVTVIWWIFKDDNREHVEMVCEAKEKNKFLKDKFYTRFGPIELNSNEAQQMKAAYERMQKWAYERKKLEDKRKHHFVSSSSLKIKHSLSRFESGDYNSWWELCFLMTINDDGSYFTDELEPDLTRLPGWNNSDIETQNRILTAAKEYISAKDAAKEQWLGTKKFHRPAASGYKAFLLLMKVEPIFLEQLDQNVWKKWASIIIGYPLSSNKLYEDDTHFNLISQAYKNAPDEIISMLLVLIDQENQEYSTLFIIRKLEYCWDAKLALTLLKKIKDPSLKPQCFHALLSDLIKYGNKNAIDFANSFLTLPISKEEDAQERSKAAALSVLTQAPDAGWDAIWSILQDDKEFGKKIILSLPASFENRKSVSLVNKIDAHKVVDLYIWLCNQFPYKEGPDIEGAHFVDDRESVAHFRDSLLRALENQGTDEAIKAITKIQRELPFLDFINYTLASAKEKYRQYTWQPMSPEEFLILTQNPNARAILNADDLGDMIIESLNRLQTKLQGETPRAIFLWDGMPKIRKFRPKSENDLSDYIKTYLEDDLRHSGIVAMREVEISRRQGIGGKPGERTDIYVAGIVNRTNELIRVVIEVKGCWHENVLGAMKEQLVDRYLKDKDYCGIYLIGWFDCHQWDGKDPRRKKIPNLTLKEARNEFDRQANSLSKNGKTIKSFVLNCALR